MIATTMVIIKKTYEEHKLKTLIEEAKQKEGFDIKKDKRESSYVNPCKLRIGSLEKQRKYVSNINFQEYCPV